MATPAAPVAAPPAAPAPAPAAPAPVASPASSSAPAAAPAAAPSPAAPAGGGAQPPAAAPAAPAPTGAAAPAPAKYDPATATAPPNAADFPATEEGQYEFMGLNTKWALAHPEEAARLRAARNAEIDGAPAPDGDQPDAAAAAPAPEGEQPGAPAAQAEQPAAAAPAAAATPAVIEGWTAKAPELKGVFEKYPEIRDAMMETARGLEAAKPVLDIVSTPEEAQFAVEHANRLVTLQANWMLGADDPEMAASAWDQTVEMFKERDANGAEVKGADGKPKLGADFKPFVTTAAKTALSDLAGAVNAQIATLTERQSGVYPNEAAKAADAEALTQLGYEKAAFDFVLGRLEKPAETALPQLPPNATPEQIAFQKKLEEERAALDQKTGKLTAEQRKAETVKLNRAIDGQWSATIVANINAEVEAMKARGEYVSDLAVNDKWIDPATGKASAHLTDFGARCYIGLNEKIRANPVATAKLAQLEALGEAGKDARIAELNKLTARYLPGVIDANRWRLRGGAQAGPAKGGPPASGPGAVARVEPLSQGTVVPATMDASQARAWAETEAPKTPGWASMTETDREALTMSMAFKKRHGG